MSSSVPQVLTANRLLDGEVVYLAGDGAWVESIAAAQVLATPAHGEAALAKGVEAERNLHVVHAYLFDVTQQLKPVKMREIIRAAGPTVRQDLGKQAR
ncbi:MAG: DUF2849 domain-containing protein [Alphaproteobacteria bacterium]|nr:DUF2849 domain-containing protein [Alphaproteobacteria bacterium]